MRETRSLPTPLVHAIFKDDIKEVNRLLDSGADPNQFSSDGQYSFKIDFTTPLMWAIWSSIFWTAKGLDIEILKTLLAYGADLNHSTGTGHLSHIYGAFESAIAIGSYPAVELLLANGANCCSIDSESGSPPLNIAISFRSASSRFPNSLPEVQISKQYDSIFAILWKYGASPNLADTNGNTALHIAALSCDSVAVEMLIRHGASLSAKNHEGKTPENGRVDLPIAGLYLLFSRNIKNDGMAKSINANYCKLRSFIYACETHFINVLLCSPFRQYFGLLNNEEEVR